MPATATRGSTKPLKPRALLGQYPGSCSHETTTSFFAPFPMIGLATSYNTHRALSNLPTYRLAVLSSKWPCPCDTVRRPQGSILNSDTGTSTRVSWSRSQSIMPHPPSAPSAEPVIARGEDEVLLKERLKALIEDSASPSTDRLWSMSADRMGLERQLSFRTFKLCWVRRIRSRHKGLELDVVRGCRSQAVDDIPRRKQRLTDVATNRSS